MPKVLTIFLATMTVLVMMFACTVSSARAQNRPAVAAAGAQQVAADAPALSAAPQGVTLGERVNSFLDDLLALGNRMLELPLFMLLAGAGAACTVCGLAVRFFTRKGDYPRLTRSLRYVMGGVVVFAFVFVVDRKINMLQNAVKELRARNSADALTQLGRMSQNDGPGLPGIDPHGAPAEKNMAIVPPTTTRPAERIAANPPAHPVAVEAAPAPPATRPAPAKRQTYLFDEDAANKALKKQFGIVGARPTVYDQATDLLLIRVDNPMVHAFLTVINLNYPGVEVKLGATLDNKTLTSAFARTNDCSVAINGEAGLSPRPGSGLGDWRGNMVKLGEVLSRENKGVPRPYLSFDRQSHATFTAAAVRDRTLPADSYNVMWGRLDAIVNGVVQTADERNRQPRTAMGINKEGTLLYLLVVDGRQPQYSMGFTRAEVGYLLKAYGAYNAMLCDEGGSSCMYLKKFGGISNIPSDNQGMERPTYTHFGITVHEVQ